LPSISTLREMSTDYCIPAFDNLLAIFFFNGTFSNDFLFGGFFWYSYDTVPRRFPFPWFVGKTKIRFTSIHIIGLAPLLDQLRFGVFKSKVVDFARVLVLVWLRLLEIYPLFGHFCSVLSFSTLSR
jgi:hypothetical protein